MTAPAEAAPPLLAMHGVVKRFGGVQALRGVDFDLRQGEIHALLGENGAGKSTLMNVLSGVIEPDAGEMEINGAGSPSIKSAQSAIERGAYCWVRSAEPVPTHKS